ncbi:hypothetical protein PWP87_14505 [Paenibacillus amylolyticus]
MIFIPLVVRSTVNATGAITFTGNTLGLSRSETAGVPGTQDSIGGFTTTNTSVQYGTYPLGTTSLYQSNSSAAILVLPAGSTVLYAELIWGGSYINGTVNLSSAINNPVTFTTPAGSFSVTPDPVTYNQFDLGNNAAGYVRSANVTTLVQNGGAGTYITGAVVGTIVITNDSTANHAGWTLGVIYQNPNLPFRNMSLRAGGVLVQSTSPPVVTTLTGFATPSPVYSEEERCSVPRKVTRTGLEIRHYSGQPQLHRLLCPGPIIWLRTFLHPKSMGIRERLTQRAPSELEIRSTELRVPTLSVVVKAGISPMWMCQPG